MADEAKPASDFLDQSEIDKLLAQTVETQARKSPLWATGVLARATFRMLTQRLPA